MKGINRNRFTPVVVSLTKGGYWYERIKKLDIEIIQIPRIGHWDFSRLFKLIRILKENKPVLVHTLMFSANSYGRIAALIAGVPTIIASERSSYEIGKNKKRYETYIDRILAFYTSGIICNSRTTSTLLIKKYSFDRKIIYTVYNGIRADKFSQSETIDIKKIAPKVIGTVGNLTVPKNYKLFLNTAKVLLEEYNGDNLKFLIVGDGLLKDELKEYSQVIGVDDKVVFTGSRDDVPDLLHMMDVFVLSSNWEGLSNAVMEAMASGLPCVVTDVGGNSELVADGITGFVVPPNDSRKLAFKILYLLNDNQTATQLGRAGKNRINRDFSVGKMILETERIYSNLTSFNT